MNHQAANANGVRRTAQPKKSISSWRRLKQDYLMIMKDPVPYVTVAPLPADFLEWHYIIRGPEDSPYKGGIYHGKLRFPVEYPFKPPSIYMITPSGRFKTNTRLCLSFSDFHPDTWNPTWSLSTILTGLLSFMLEEHNAVGSIMASDTMRRQMAKKSLDFNLKDQLFVELFPDVADEIKQKRERDQKAEQEALNAMAAKHKSSNTSGGLDNSAPSPARTNFVLSCVYHLLAVVVLILFFYIVQWVMSEKSITG